MNHNDLDKIWDDGTWFVLLVWIAFTEALQYRYDGVPPDQSVWAALASAAWVHRFVLGLLGIVVIVSLLAAIGAGIRRTVDRIVSRPLRAPKNKRKDRGKPSTF